MLLCAIDHCHSHERRLPAAIQRSAFVLVQHGGRSQAVHKQKSTVMTMSAASGEDQQLASEDFETNTKKSERKRQREKQRRSDLASAFEELASLLSEIEPEEDVGGGRTKKSRRRSGPGEAPAREVDQLEALGMTRLDLIGRTIETLRRLHRENSDLRQSLEHQSHRAEGDDKVRESLEWFLLISIQ